MVTYSDTVLVTLHSALVIINWKCYENVGCWAIMLCLRMRYVSFLVAGYMYLCDVLSRVFNASSL